MRNRVNKGKDNHWEYSNAKKQNRKEIKEKENKNNMAYHCYIAYLTFEGT